jgi:hypothetical protein
MIVEKRMQGHVDQVRQNSGNLSHPQLFCCVILGSMRRLQAWHRRGIELLSTGSLNEGNLPAFLLACSLGGVC